jgi:hypothetical protein
LFPELPRVMARDSRQRPLCRRPRSAKPSFFTFFLSTLTNINIYNIYHIQNSHNTYISHPKHKCHPTLHI